VGKQSDADDLPVFWADVVKESEALLDLGAASLAPSPEAQIDHVAPVTDIEYLFWVKAKAGPGFSELVPIATNVLLASHGRDIGEDGRDIEQCVLCVHLLHGLKLSSVPAVEPLLEA
jgi:hypothetical protein